MFSDPSTLHPWTDPHFLLIAELIRRDGGELISPSNEIGSPFTGGGWT